METKTPNYAQFYGAVICNEGLFYSSIENNGLYFIKNGEEESRLVTTFPDEDLLAKKLHRSIEKCGDLLLLFPYMSCGIYTYCLKTGKLNFIQILNKEPKRIAGVFKTGEDYILVPTILKDDFLVFSPRSGEVKVIGELNKIMSNNRSGAEYDWCDAFGSCLIQEKILLISLAETGIVVAIWLDTFDSKTFKIDDFEIGSIDFFDNKIWLSHCKDNKVMSIDWESNERKEYAFPTEDDTQRPIYRFALHRDDLFAIPGQGKWIRKYDKESDSWAEYIDPYSIEGFKRLFPNILFFGSASMGDELLLFPKAANGIVRINTASNTADLLPIYVDEESSKQFDLLVRKENYRLLKNAEEKYGIFNEDIYDLTLENYVKYVADKDIFKEV